MSTGISSALGFSLQELADLRGVYELFDVNGQGGIEVDELWKALRLLGFKVSRRRVHQMHSDLQDSQGSAAASRPVDYRVFLQVVNKLQGSSYDRHGEILQVCYPTHGTATSVTSPAPYCRHLATWTWMETVCYQLKS